MKTNNELESLLDEIEAKIKKKLSELTNNLNQQQIKKLNIDGVGKGIIQLAIEEIKTKDLAKLSVQELIRRLGKKFEYQYKIILLVASRKTFSHEVTARA